MSEIFSKQFVLPDAYIMNTFDFEVYYTVYKNQSARITDYKITSSITKRTSGDTNASEPINRDLLAAIRNWFDANNNVLLQTVNGFHMEDSIPLVAQVYYSPMLYAQSGDTLYCSGTKENEYLSEGDDAATYYQFFIRNYSNTPYYALVRRNQNKITLLVHDAQTGKLVNVVNYHIDSAALITKTGNQLYMAEDGKRIRIKQLWDGNHLLSAERYNDEKKVIAKYEFQYITWYPKLHTKDVLYPSGSIKLHIVYEKGDVSVSAFNEDGTKAKYTPAKDVEKAINGYFKKNFHAPAIGYAYSGINYFTLKFPVICGIDENGNIHITPPDAPYAKWSYNYKSDFIQPNRINQMVDKEYGSYFREFWKPLTEQALSCKPAMINGMPIASTTIVNIEHTFMPRYTTNADNAEPDNSTDTLTDENITYIVVEQMPSFPGGSKALFKFLSENVQYPAIAKENGIQGCVRCQFIVNKDGSITNVEVVKSSGDPSLDKEAVRVLQMMPNWKPGAHGGKTVRVRYNLPVNFTL